MFALVTLEHLGELFTPPHSLWGDKTCSAVALHGQMAGVWIQLVLQLEVHTSHTASPASVRLLNGIQGLGAQEGVRLCLGVSCLENSMDGGAW